MGKMVRSHYSDYLQISYGGGGIEHSGPFATKDLVRSIQLRRSELKYVFSFLKYLKRE